MLTTNEYSRLHLEATRSLKKMLNDLSDALHNAHGVIQLDIKENVKSLSEIEIRLESLQIKESILK